MSHLNPSSGFHSSGRLGSAIRKQMQRQGEEEDADSPEALGKFLVRLSGLADEGWEPALLVLDGNTLSVYRRASHREQVRARGWV